MTATAGRVDIRPADPLPRDLRRARLLDRVRRGLDTMELVLDEVVDPAVPSNQAAAHGRKAAKIAGEAAMLLRMADRALDDEPSRRRIRRLAARLAPWARSPDVRANILSRPSRAPMRVVAHACIRDLCPLDQAFDRLVRLAFGSSVASANERVPYRILDAAWTRHLLMGDRELDHPAMDLSPIGTGVDLLAATTEDAYAFTHAVIYATDFGRLPLPARFDVAMLESTADAICVKALDENDLDLLGEVLMAPAVLRRPWTPTQTFAWRALDAVWAEHGFVPGPGLPEAEADEDHGATARRVLGTAYHTLFVSAICVATLASAGNLPPVAIPEGPAADTNELATNASACLAEWARTPDHERRRLGSLVFGLRVHRAMADRNLGTMQSAVDLAVRTGLADSVLAVQSIEYLERAVALTI